jgi:hypothetical protein
MKQYLEKSEFINWDCPKILELAHFLKDDLGSDVEACQSML